MFVFNDVMLLGGFCYIMDEEENRNTSGAAAGKVFLFLL
jgi:hypothetical protein